MSGGIIGAVMVLVGVGIGYGSLDWWSRFALGIGTWSMVAPIILGFQYDSAPFWSHMAGGLVAMIVGIGGHELIVGRAREPSDA
jgi:hypothetical protein